VNDRRLSCGWAWAALAILPAAALLPRAATAGTYRANPSNIISKLRALRAGDTVVLEAGEYPGPWRLVNKHGKDGQWITITGPDPPLEAVLLGPAGRNTLDLENASYLVLRRLKFDGRDIADDAIKAGMPHGHPVHHIKIEHCTIVNHDRHQKYVGINCQAPAWDWEIRNNRILSAGTGIYLGDSMGRFPFLRGLIEYNLVRNPKGYCLQIKHYDKRSGRAGMPVKPCQNVIRHNVFAKNNRKGEIGDRPNVLLDGFPESGTGSRDRHRFYGNVVMSNPREALLQGSGRLSIHDNVFLSSARPAVSIQAHEGKAARSILVYHNTIITDREPVRISGTTPGSEVAVVGNVMASGKIRDDVALRLSGNLVMGLWRTSSFFRAVSADIEEKMDLQPLRVQRIRIPEAATKLLDRDGSQIVQWRLKHDCPPPPSSPPKVGHLLGWDFTGVEKPPTGESTKSPGWGYCGAFWGAFSTPAPLLKYAGPDAADRTELRVTTSTTQPAP